MKKILIFSVVLLSSFSAFSQTISCDWGDAFTRDMATDKYRFVCSTPTGDEFYLLRSSASVSDPFVWLEKYSASGQLFSKTVPCNEGVFQNGFSFEEIIPAKDQFLFFYRGWSKDEKKSTWKVRTCDMNGEYAKDTKELCSHIAKNVNKSGNYYVCASPDASLFAVLMTSPKEKDVKEKLLIKVYDSKTLAEKWSKEVGTEDESGKGSFEIAMDNQSNVFLMKRMADGGKWTYNMYAMSSSASALKPITMDLPAECDIESYQFKMTPQGNLFFTGFYTFRKGTVSVGSGALAGSFCVKVNTATQTATCKANPFTERISGGQQPLASEMKMKDLIVLPSGSIYLMAEHQKESISSKTDQTGKTVYDGELQSNKVIVVCYKNDGLRDWEATINKNQTSRTTERFPTLRWDSYTCGLVGDKLYFVYNNLNLPSTWKEMNGSVCSKSSFTNARQCPFFYVLEANGNLKYGDKLYGLPLYNMLTKTEIQSPAMFPVIGMGTPAGLLLFCASGDAKQLEIGKLKVE
jgi:hypothetical protein